jgi:hypothetical protein
MVGIMTTVLKNGTIVTADMTYKADVLFHAVCEVAGVLG